MEKDTPKEETKPESPEEKIQEKPSKESEDSSEKDANTSEDNPLDMSKILNAAKDFMPEIAGMLKKKEKDPSTMCEFTIKGSDEFVIKCLDSILG